jgi:hypothetical protein
MKSDCPMHFSSQRKTLSVQNRSTQSARHSWKTGSDAALAHCTGSRSVIDVNFKHRDDTALHVVRLSSNALRLNHTVRILMGASRYRHSLPSCITMLKGCRAVRETTMVDNCL